ncbi:MAG: hypothetical protein AAF902_03025 [Chloroflexota bacterium]
MNEEETEIQLETQKPNKISVSTNDLLVWGGFLFAVIFLIYTFIDIGRDRAIRSEPIYPPMTADPREHEGPMMLIAHAKW